MPTPDIVAISTPAEFEDPKRDSLLNPRLIVEVVSDSTERLDGWTKARYYRRMKSLQELVLVATDEPLVEHFVRQSTNSWLLTLIGGLDRQLELVTMPARVPLADIYAGVTFPDPPPQPPAGRPR
jgi:Uma2 family endonuclease